jgi:hypothetical protein
MGFEHDPANGTSPSNASYPYAFGHYVDGSYRTVMSYSRPCGSGCTRVAHHSNPDILNAGVPTGIAEQRDNARAGDQTAPIVANFRLATAAMCSNGVLDAGEDCDGADLGGASCSDLGCGGGSVSCAADCTLDYSTCSACPVCDFDGICEAGEDCSGCSDCPGGTSTGTVCGNGICEGGDGEDCFTCPSDCAGKTNGKPSNRFCCGGSDACDRAECTSQNRSCTTASSPPVAFCCGDAICTEGIEDACGCPECTKPGAELFCDDGVDNDCNGFTDCEDSGCDQDPFCATGGGCSAIGDSCTDDFECCSNKCKGKRGNKVCKAA